jgi:uncharacterized delta-60 repeat protein
VVILSGVVGTSGTETGFGLHRVTASGRLDHRFGRHGRVDGDGASTSLAVGPDGSILVGTGGSRRAGSIARFDSSGSADGAFADGGVATPSLLFGAPIAMHFDPYGRIVAVDRTLAAVRLLANGTADLTFAGALPRQDVGGVIWDSAAFEPDGALLAAGREVGSYRLALARVPPEWRLDPAFGSGGTVRFPGVQNQSAVRLTRGYDGGGIVAVPGGGFVRELGWWLFAFDNLGAVTGPIRTGDLGTVGLTRDAVFVSGDKFRCFCAARHPLRTLLRRYTPTLQLDEDFGRRGFLLSMVRSTYTPDIVVQPDGRILVLSNVVLSARKVAAKMALQRYLP